MAYLPLHTFRRCVQRYPSKYPTKTFSHLDQFLCLAFAQLTYRESLRDIETCLRAHQTKLYHLGIRGNIAKSTLADANEQRDWRIYQDFAMSLIQTARTLYASDSFAVELEQTAYALDTTTIDLCLSVFPWAKFRQTKAAVKLHTLLDLRGNIPTFIHISDGKMHEVNVLDILIPEYGTTKNTVKTQILIVISVYVLVAIVKKQLKTEATLYTILQILSLVLFKKHRLINCLLILKCKSLHRKL